MSIRSEITRINNNIAAAYTAAEAKGATMPVTENSDNLADTVASIPTGSTPTLITKQITENGTYTAAEDNADGYSEVKVNVPDASKAVLDSLIDRSITTITSDVISIGAYAFDACHALTKVNFLEATFIGVYAFSTCRALTEINFPKVTYIGNGAFQYCHALTKVNFLEVTVIEATAFSNCTALTETNFPKVTNIGNVAFSNCTALKYFDMSEVGQVPRITSSSFNSTTCIFLFRDQTQLDEYASATNWAALADRFQIKEVTT